jgi:prepilin peptidase CpaA
MFVIAVYLIFSMLAVIWFDVSRFTIPNWLVGSLLVLYPAALMMAHSPVDWRWALLGAGIVFAVGYGVFAMKWMGGGDIKLMAVLALWVGFENLLNFVFLVALLGGLFSIGILVLRKMRPHLPRKNPGEPWPRIMRDGEAVPYGVAIAFGFMVMLYWGMVPVIF